MAITGYYYLHQNGSLIFKRETDGGQVADFRESDLVRHFWRFNSEDRECAWRIVVEASALGADEARVRELVGLWQCTDSDAAIYASLIGAALYRDGNAWCATASDFVNLAESPAGFGQTAVCALADLAKRLGFQASKTMWWSESFSDLLKQRISTAVEVL